jgi:hypothetical protein
MQREAPTIMSKIAYSRPTHKIAGLSYERRSENRPHRAALAA